MMMINNSIHSKLLPVVVVILLLQLSYFLVVVAATSSIKPQINIGINADTLKSRPFVGTFFEPSVQYTTSGTISNTDIAYEVRVSVFFFFKTNKLRYNFFKTKTNVCKSLSSVIVWKK
jgi:hypothetical protein